MSIVKIVNAEDGSDARYDVSQMSAAERTQFDSEGRPLGSDNPDQWTWTPGLPGARQGNAEGGGGGSQQPGGGAGGLLSSPYYQQILAIVNAQGASDAANRRTAIQQALIGFGETPGGFTDKYGDVDELTRGLAEKNTTTGISTKARLLQARSDAIRQFSRGLSARGLRRSGAKGYGLRRRQLTHDQGYSDALQQLLGHTGNVYSQFGQNEYGRQMQLANALGTAAQSFSGYGSGGSGGGGGGGASSFVPIDPSRSFYSQVFESPIQQGTQTSQFGGTPSFSSGVTTSRFGSAGGGRFG